jgi:hypothetical protein
MTERVFRKRFVLLWVGYTVIAIVVSRVLLISQLGVEWQRLIYQAIWLGTVIVAVVLYRRGPVPDRAEREQVLAKPGAEIRSPFGFLGSAFFLGMLAVGLGMGIWDARYESWKFGVCMLLIAPINLWWMTIPFLQIRNAKLRRMQDVGLEADSQGE